MAKTKQVTRKNTGSDMRALRKNLVTKEVRKSAGSGHKHASCMADARRMSRLGLESHWLVGTNRTGDRQSPVKRRVLYERGLSSADLEGEGFLGLDENAFGES